MGIWTFVGDMIAGEQARPAGNGLARTAPVALRGHLVEPPLAAPQELLRALAEAAALFRDNVAGMSAGGTLAYKLRGIVAWVPEPWMDKVAFSRQPQHVRVQNAQAVLAGILAGHGYIDATALTDWQVRKKESRDDVSDGFSDAFVAQPDSGIGVEFTFEGSFVTQDQSQTDSHGRAPRARLDYRLLDDAGALLQAGSIQQFPATVGRGFSAIPVPDRLELVSGPHLEFTLSPLGEPCVQDIGAQRAGSTNGTWLEQGTGVQRLAARTRLPARGRLILGAGTVQARAAVLEFDTADAAKASASEHANPAHPPTRHAQPTEVAFAGVRPTQVELPEVTGRLGVVMLRYANGALERHVINSLPFVIGREPDTGRGSSAVVRESCAKVSRSHVRIEDLGSNGFFARNLAAGRNGCFMAGRREAADFFWPFSEGGDADAGWLRMGGNGLDDATVWARVQGARS